MYQNSRNAEFVVLWFVFVIIKTNNRLLSTHFKEKDFFFSHFLVHNLLTSSFPMFLSMFLSVGSWLIIT